MESSYKPVYHSSICLPFENEAHYHDCMKDFRKCRSYLDQMFNQFPELFPSQWNQGYTFHGFVYSKKQDLLMRRVLLWTGKAFQIRPSFVLPYMVARTDEVEKALFLRRWGVPFDALSYVFGAYPMFWYRAYVSLGRNQIVGTTVKTQIPEHLSADEKHTWHQGKKVYLATTVAKGCILGATLSSGADTSALTHAYQIFQKEAKETQADYSPVSVNTDGWEPTRKAWKHLFPLVRNVLCFLHAFLAIRNSCKSQPTVLNLLSEKVWDSYHAASRGQFSQRLRRLKEWAQEQMYPGILLEKVMRLCQKAPDFAIAFELPGCHSF